MNSRPASLVTAVVLIFVQAFFNGAAGLFLLVEVSDRLDHGQEVQTWDHVLSWGSVVAAAIFALGGVLLLRGVDVMRLLVALLELLAIISGFVSLILGAFQAVIGLAIAVVVLFMLFNRETTRWFTRVRAARSAD
jgi:hypothetical protein